MFTCYSKYVDNDCLFLGTNFLSFQVMCLQLYNVLVFVSHQGRQL
jgi:hypothetical protein